MYEVVSQKEEKTEWKFEQKTSKSESFFFEIPWIKRSIYSQRLIKLKPFEDELCYLSTAKINTNYL